MPSFADAWGKATAVILDIFADAEAMRFLPMGASVAGGRSSPDGGRAIVERRAVFDDGAARAAYGAGVAKDQPEAAGHVTTRIVINVPAASLPWRPKRDDRVLRTRTGLTYRIAEVREDGDGWLALDVNLLSRP